MDIETLKSYNHDHWGLVAIPKSFVTSSGDCYLKQVKMYTYVYINAFKRGVFPIWEGTIADIVTSLGYSSVRNCSELVGGISLSIKELITEGYLDIVDSLSRDSIQSLPSGEFVRPHEVLKIMIRKSFRDIASTKDYLTLSGLELFTILNYTKLKPAPPGDCASASRAKVKIIKLLIIYLVIKERVLRRPERFTNISRDDICTSTDVSRNTAKTAVDILKALGLIEYRKIGGVRKGNDSFFNQSTVYVLAGDDDDETLNRLNYAVDSCYSHNERNGSLSDTITPYYVKNDDGIILDPMIGCE